MSVMPSLALRCLAANGGTTLLYLREGRLDCNHGYFGNLTLGEADQLPRLHAFLVRAIEPLPPEPKPQRASSRKVEVDEDVPIKPVEKGDVYSALSLTWRAYRDPLRVTLEYGSDRPKTIAEGDDVKALADWLGAQLKGAGQ